MSAFETLLAADGVSRESLACVRAVVENDGMVTTGQAIRALRLNGRTIRKLCAEHRVPRVSRNGRQGSLVHLATLLRVVGRGSRGSELSAVSTVSGERPDLLVVDDLQRTEDRGRRTKGGRSALRQAQGGAGSGPSAGSGQGGGE